MYQLRAFLFALGVTLFSLPAFAGPFFGAKFGMGIFSPSEDFHKSIGKGRTSGSDAVPANSTAYRNHSTDMPSFLGEFTLGFALNSSVIGFGLDARGRYAWALGAVRKFTQPSTVSDLTPGRSEYHHLEVDGGLRLYLTRFFYLRPHFGVVTNAIYKLSFLVPKAYHHLITFSEDGSRKAWGLGAYLSPGIGIFRFEIGGDYTVYRSRFGGQARHASFMLGPTIAF